MKLSSEVPLGSFEEQVLLALLRTAPDAYATAIRHELENVTGRSVAIGAVYVTLDRLESKGLITSTRAQRKESGSRRMFAATPAGAHALSATKAMRERLWRGVDLRLLLRG